MYTLKTPLKYVRGIGPKSLAQLTKFGLNNVLDLLLYLPIRYEDRRLILTISQLKLLQTSQQQPTILAKVAKTSAFRKGTKSLQKALVYDKTGKLNLTWFNSPYVLQTLREGEEFYFSGKFQPNYHSLAQPTIEKPSAAEQLHTGRLVPVYSSSLGLKTGSLRRLLKTIIDQLALTEDPLQSILKKQKNLISLATTDFNQVFESLHFPDELSDIEVARRRLALEELLSLIKTAQKHQKDWQSRRATCRLTATIHSSLDSSIKKLPFALTKAQTKALQEITQDLQKPCPMNRMLQGDVGSGKTIVAGLSAQNIIATGYSVCLIAPTRILAKQHQQTISELLPNLKTQLILGSQTNQLVVSASQPKLYIGTQALLNKMAEINPGLVIYDEQHRFGVKQRTQLAPHLLTMTATPIPRSLMLSVFSYLDLSVLDELPAGRKLTKTWLVPRQKKAKALAWIKSEIQKTDGLALIVCPFIDPSDKLALENIQAASALYLELKPYFEPNLPTALLHGKIKKDEQAKIIQKIQDRQIKILISTSIVELGLDLPQASIIVIEEAERFGLASLHQLRGRVGRRNQQGYCLVLTKSTTDQVTRRLTQFAKTTKGQELAEWDLKNRGAGELFGLEQHGFGGLEFTTWANVALIKIAQDLSQQIPPNWLSQILVKPDQNLPIATN